MLKLDNELGQAKATLQTTSTELVSFRAPVKEGCQFPFPSPAFYTCHLLKFGLPKLIISLELVLLIATNILVD